jgi:hypothetical protein
MLPADPLTSFVASCVLPAAMTTVLWWNIYLLTVRAPLTRRSEARGA